MFLTLVLLGYCNPLREGRVERGQVAVPELRGPDTEELARLQKGTKEGEVGRRKGGLLRKLQCQYRTDDCVSLPLSHLRDCHFPVEVEPIPPLL